MIKFSIGGRNIEPENLGDALMQMVLENVRAELMEKIGSLRDPETGEFPTVVVRGDSLEDLSIQVEGSPELVALVRERLEPTEEEGEEGPKPSKDAQLKVFLSYASDDKDLAKKLAESLQANGLETWWDGWCIYPGDSLRQRIDEGIAGCTHFLVLLTPASIGKPWVNQEMDAGLVRKLNEQCKFLPVRYQLPASALPPLLSGMHTPEITADSDFSQLINDIYGVTRRPPLGAPPAVVSNSQVSETGYSPAATEIARFFVERTTHGLPFDPQLWMHELAKETGLSIEDTKDGLFELSDHIEVSCDHVRVKGTLFFRV
jgi:hypothetical protein